jgi:hypothetical protein
MSTNDEVKITRKYYGLTWPTLIVTAILVLTAIAGVVEIYLKTIAVAVSD